MKTRTDLLNFLAEKYNLERYLEIGVQDRAQNFDKIKCSDKTGVDPDPNAGADYPVTSDEFFNRYAAGKVFDLIFIDGMHEAFQVKRDFENALNVVSPHGFVVLHDCNPESIDRTLIPRPTKSGPWNGDVYRAASGMVANKKDKVTVDIDNGCCVVRPGKAQILGMVNDWEHFNTHRKELLNLVSWDEFVKL